MLDSSIDAATSIGSMRGTVTIGGSFTASQTVVDLIYRPLSTPWLTAARDVGANAANGVGMLLHQAAIQLELWTGIDAPIDAMRDSVADIIG